MLLKTISATSGLTLTVPFCEKPLFVFGICVARILYKSKIEFKVKKIVFVRSHRLMSPKTTSDVFLDCMAAIPLTSYVTLNL